MNIGWGRWRHWREGREDDWSAERDASVHMQLCNRRAWRSWGLGASPPAWVLSLILSLSLVYMYMSMYVYGYVCFVWVYARLMYYVCVIGIRSTGDSPMLNDARRLLGGQNCTFHFTMKLSIGRTKLYFPFHSETLS